MSEKNVNQNYPSAPPATSSFLFSGDNQFMQYAPPPTYEESLKMNGIPPSTMPMTEPNKAGMPGQYNFIPAQTYNPAQTCNPAQTYNPAQYGYANPYQMHMHQQQQYYHQQAPNYITPSSGPQVLTFARGAEIRTSVTGAVHVPPPPPGYAPTAAQLAAMRGEKVLVTKKKTPFF